MNARSTDRIRALRSEVETLRRASGVIELPMKDGTTQSYRGNLLLESIAAMRDGDTSFFDWLDRVDVEALASSGEIVAVSSSGPIPDMSEDPLANEKKTHEPSDEEKAREAEQETEIARRNRVLTAPLSELDRNERRERRLHTRFMDHNRR